MAESAFVDSAGLEYLLDLQDSLVERLGTVKFAHCEAGVKKILEMTRLDTDFEVYDDVSMAVKVSQT